MRARILAIFLILLLGLGGVAAKLFSIQIQHGDRLTERATKQYHRLVPLVSRRGTISDRAGRELAVSLRVSSVFAQPGAIANPAVLLNTRRMQRMRKVRMRPPVLDFL